MANWSRAGVPSLSSLVLLRLEGVPRTFCLLWREALGDMIARLRTWCEGGR
jgi:hypothetical protein